jgi:hypothetical protein
MINNYIILQSHLIDFKNNLVSVTLKEKSKSSPPKKPLPNRPSMIISSINCSKGKKYQTSILFRFKNGVEGFLLSPLSVR